MKKKIISLLLAAAMAFSGSAVTVHATQTRAYYYNRNYLLTKFGMDDIVAVAMLQRGKNKNDLHYSEAWCADFVSDCAMIAGVSDVIPPNGKVSELYKEVMAHGGVEVSVPQKGDLVFYYCNACVSHWKHVGIMTDSIQSIEGNYSGKVSLVKGIYRDGSGHTVASGTVIRKFVRPDYAHSAHVVPSIVKPTDTTNTSGSSSGTNSPTDNGNTANNGIYSTNGKTNTNSGNSTSGKTNTNNSNSTNGKTNTNSNNSTSGKTKTDSDKKNTSNSNSKDSNNKNSNSNKTNNKTDNATETDAKFTKKKAGNYKVVTKDTPLIVRSEPDTKSAVLGSLAKGTVIKVTKTTGKWALFSYKGMDGYLSMDFLKKTTEKVTPVKTTATNKTTDTTKNKKITKSKKKTSKKKVTTTKKK